MTDKVQKIKDWISKEQEGLIDAQGNFEYPEHEGAFHILSNLDYYIDSLQEEPVSEDLEEAASVFAREDSCDIKNPANFYYVVADKARIFKTGAKWKKEQMINSAKKSKIVITSGGILLSDLKIEDFDYADNVKVIIVKENKDE